MRAESGDRGDRDPVIARGALKSSSNLCGAILISPPPMTMTMMMSKVRRKKRDDDGDERQDNFCIPDPPGKIKAAKMGVHI